MTITQSALAEVPISYADLNGANIGQRPDLINLAGGVFVTPDGLLWSSYQGQLVAARNVSPTVVYDANGKPTLIGPRGTINVAGKARNHRLMARGLTGNVTTLAVTDANFVTGATAGGVSTMTRVGLATDFDAVRIWIANNDTGAQSVTSVLVASPNASGVAKASAVADASILRGAGGFVGGLGPSTNGDTTRDMVYGATAGSYNTTINSVSKTFMPATFDGGKNLTKTLPARLGAAASNNMPSWTATDWMPVSSQPRADGGTTPLLDVYVSWGIGATATMYAFGTDAPSVFARMANDATYERMWRTHFVAGNVTNVSSFGSVQRVQPKSPAIIIQYRSRKDGIQVMMIGDSIYEGIGQTLPHTNFATVAALALHTSDMPVEVLPLARISQHSEDQLNHARQLISEIKPTIMVAQSISTNRMNRDSELALKLTTRASVADVLVEAEKVGAVPVVIGITPTTTAAVNYGTADAYRIAANVELSTMLPSEGGVYVPLDATLGTGGTVGGQLQLGAEFSADGIHLNDAGHIAVKIPVQAGITSAIALL
jgi:lysophospholipase L1-like esterase